VVGTSLGVVGQPSGKRSLIMDALSIRHTIEKITNGQIRIPAFQRGFVWDADLVAHLMDSIYKGYPFGAVILWRTRTQLKAERNLGDFELPERDPDFPIDYVLDGQQRLTSVFGVFQTEIEPEKPPTWNKVYYDMAAVDDLQESWFFALGADEVVPGRHFPIGTFFDPVAYRASTEGLDDDAIKHIDQVQAVFKEATIPVQSIETDDRSKVAIVFERVNRLGVELDVFQLLSAWTWSEEFDLQNEFNELAEELEPFGFGEVGEDTNLLLRCCAGIVSGDPAPGAVIGLNGAEVRERFDEIQNGLRGAIDFVRSNLGVEKLRNLPYPTLLVPLAAYFAAKDGVEVPLSSDQRKTLLRWFWRACLSRRFSAGVFTNLRRDLAEVQRLQANGTSDLAEFPAAVEADFFVDTRFTISAVNTKTFVLMLAQLKPLSFASGAPVQLSNVLKEYNRHEFHHCYPQKYLKDQGRESADINRLANFVFLSRADNRHLGGVAPSEYRTMMPGDVSDILARAAVPESLFHDDYDAFIRERSEMLAARARTLRDEASL
jgi:hypothetical protein